MVKFFLMLLAFFNVAFADINFIGNITEESLKKFYKNTHKLALGDTVYVYFNSEGGLVDPAFVIANKMRSYKTICLAENAMSAAMYMYQACTVRAITPKGQLMVHNIQIMFEEKKMIDFEEMKDYVGYVDWQNKMMIGSIAYRAGMPPVLLSSLIANASERRIFYTDQEAIDYKMADIVVKNMKELKEKFK